MTVPVQDPINQSTANGSTAVFPYQFLILDEDHLKVYLDDALVTSGFSVSGVGTETGGNVTFTTNPANGVLVTLLREVPAERTVDYQNAGDFLAPTVNADFNRLWMYVQQIVSRIDNRALTFKSTEDRGSNTNQLPTPQDGQVLYWSGGDVQSAPLASLADDVSFSSTMPVAPTMVAAKASATLTDGQGIFILGYYAANDGGGGAYRYEASNSDTANNGTIIALDTLPGRLVHTRTTVVTTKTYGAVLDGVVDDTAAVQAFIDSENTTVEFSGKMGISSTIKGKVGISIIGKGPDCEIIPMAGGTFTNGFMFYLNTNDGSTVIEELPAKIVGELSGFHVNNAVNSIAGLRFALFHGGYQFKNIMLTRMSQFVSKMKFYADFITIEHCHYRQPQDQSTYYAVDLGSGLGDASCIKKVDFPEHNGNETKGIRLSQAFNCNINNVLNGEHYIENSKGVSWANDHNEGGHITVDRSSVDFYGGTHYNGSDATPPVKLVDTGQDGTVRHNVTFTNRKFVVMSGGEGNPGSKDVWVHPKYNVSFKDCHRFISQNGVISKSAIHGILIADSSGVDIDDFNNYSHICSRDSRVEAEHVHAFTKIDNRSAGAIDGIAASSTTTSDWTFSGSTDTYYYKAQLFLDPVRLLGKTGGVEFSQALTNGGDAAILLVSLGDYTTNCMMRVYRGTATGSYDQCVNVPLVSVRSLVDEGNTLNSFPWISRIAGPEDTINQSFDESLTYSNGTVVAEIVGSLPTVGVFKRGDQLIKLNAAVVGDKLNREVNRLVSGSAHVLGVDWVRGYISTV
jgi:hypothetical protein